MSLNVAYTSNINSGIDTSALKEVTQEIFKRAASKTVDLSTLDLTKFKRADLGMDLYNNKVDISTARKVAINNSGMQINLSEAAVTSLKFLNSQASKSIFKTVEGKVTVAVNEETSQPKKTYELPKFAQLVKTLDLGRDKNNSNPFYNGKLVKAEKKETEDALNIFA